MIPVHNTAIPVPRSFCNDKQQQQSVPPLSCCWWSTCTAAAARQGRRTEGGLEGQHGGQQQQSSTDQGCCMIWGIPIRWAGSATRMRSSRSLHSSDALVCGGKLYSTFRMRYTTEHSNACFLASFSVADSNSPKVVARKP